MIVLKLASHAMFLLIVGLFPTIGSAAQFTVKNKGQAWDPKTQDLICNVRMSGAIQNGDLKRLEAALPDRERTLCLDSEGGSYDEAVKLAGYIIEHRIGTLVEARGKCLSACAIVFMSGVMSTGAEEWARPARQMHATAQVGFHAPFLPQSSVPAGSYDAATVLAAYQTALKGLRKLMQLNKRDAWIIGDLISPELILEMLDKEPNQLFLVDTVGRAVKYKIDVVGIKPVAKPDDKALCNACANIFDQEKESPLCKFPALRRADGSIAFSPGEEFGECRLGSIKDGNGRTKWHVQAGPAFSRHADWGGRDWTTIADWWFYPPSTPLNAYVAR